MSRLRIEAGVNPLQFLREVRFEASKVSWPTWKEVWVTTLAVMVMVAITSIFFTFVDQALGYAVATVLGFGRQL